MTISLADEFSAVRADGTIYLDTASTGPFPRRTLDAVTEAAIARTKPGRPMDWFGVLNRARVRAAELIGAASDEIALTPNTSTAIHAIAGSLPLRPNSVILGVENDFPANTFPWIVRARGADDVRYEQIATDQGVADEDAIIARLDYGDVSVLAVSWVSFLTGQRLDIAKLGAACKARNIWFSVDAIQGVGVLPLDVSSMHIDMLACGGHKWLLSPWGSGFLYVRRDLIESITPATGGWLSVRDAETFAHMFDLEINYAGDARRFEVASIPFQDFAGFNASTGLLLEMGLSNVAQRVETHVQRLAEAVDANPKFKLLTPLDPAHRAGIVSWTTDDAVSVTQRLQKAKVAFAVRGNGVIRLAPHVYIEDSEMDKVIVQLM